jgi:hypothetical protein
MIFSLLTLPIDGIKFVFNTIAKVAEEQYNGDVTEKEYVEREAAILRDLREIQNRKREMAGLPPEEEFAAGGLHGEIKEGSGASVTFDSSSWGPSDKK